jgi:hypothetical protein
MNPENILLSEKKAIHKMWHLNFIYIKYTEYTNLQRNEADYWFPGLEKNSLGTD